MTTKVSLSLDQEVLAEARRHVGSRGLSHYVSEAVRRQLQHDRLTGLLEEFERELGPLDPGVMEEVRQAWPAPAGKSGRRRRNG
jgi:Arc/MetJ-type ribon-helix-helix transcriptional regulator